MNSTQWQQLVDVEALFNPEASDPVTVMKTMVFAGGSLPCFGHDPFTCAQDACPHFGHCVADSIN
jgi:hypothetical protein